MLEVFQHDASSTRCRSYFVANTYVGFMVMFAAECIFIVRAYAVWENKLKAFTAISIIAYMTPITICFQEMTSSVSGECWIPGVVEHLGTMASSRWTTVYSLLVVAELAYSICAILAMKFLAFPVAHIMIEFQVIAQTILVTRMHRDFWKSDHSSRGTYGQSISLPTFIAVAPDRI
ncbi:hypothetical protein AZE42_09591 [Rhizopogon vesiculosus]|uniref:Uncharacterized protein n=1 Tax=Rhizopogon vesiculosus TaxID=180088 RepID=A0A1J8Q6U3_9AGAM|nr:hypothetical protein AZE42_09591 [Rhizopogon vesiculosus]